MEKKELSMEIRLLVALVLMGLVMIGSQYFYKPPPQPTPAAKKTETTTPPNPETAASPGVPTSASSKPAASAETTRAAEVPGRIEGLGEQTITVDTALYHVVFSNRGATARSWILKDYVDKDKHQVDLVNPLSLTKVAAPFSIVFTEQGASEDLANELNNALYEVHQPDKLTLEFEYSDGRVDVKKSFHFAEDSYLVSVSDQVLQDGAPLPNSMAWRGGFGDSAVVNPANYQQALYYDLDKSKLEKEPVKNAKNGPVSSAGQYSFAGLEDTYFAAVYLPQGRSLVKLTEFADSIPNAAGAAEQRVGAGVGGEGSNSFKLFIGPKDYDLLHKIDPKLDQLIDWGWFGFIAKPLFVALQWTAVHVTRNYGWAIILLTAVITTLLFPLKITSMKSAKKQQAIQPLIKAVNDKYKNLPMRDPRQSEKQEELMALYKKHGINPVGGCLPMLLQLPFFYGFYRVLYVSIALRGASFLWVHDLSQPETIPIRILPVILVITQFFAQKMTPSPGVDSSQQKMMLFMPLIFGYIFYFLQAGLVLYYLTSNVVGIAQQWILNRATPAPVPVAVDVKPATTKKKNRNG